MDTITEKYTDPSFPGSFMEMSLFYKHLSPSLQKRYSLKKVKKALLSNEHISVMKDLPRKRKHMRIVVPRIGYLYEADVAIFDKSISKYNHGYIGFLLVIDVFSKFVWCRAIRKITGNSTCKVFESILNHLIKPCENLRTDRGVDFTSVVFKNLMTKYHINHFFSDPPHKSCVAERGISTVKHKLAKYMVFKNTKTWYKALSLVVDSYNHTVHSVIGLSPASVTDADTTSIWRELYEKDFARYPHITDSDMKKIYSIKDEKVTKKKIHHAYDSPTYKLKVGDVVRLSVQRYVFMRRYSQKWTNEYFFVADRSVVQGFNMYTVKDTLNELVTGKFYEKDLLRVYIPHNTTFRVSKVLKRQGNRLLVKWEGWSNRFNSWIEKSDIHDLPPDSIEDKVSSGSD